MSGSPTDDSNRIGVPGAAMAIGGNEDTLASRPTDRFPRNRDRTSETGDRSNIVRGLMSSGMSNSDRRNGDSPRFSRGSSLSKGCTNLKDRSSNLGFESHRDILSHSSMDKGLERESAVLNGRNRGLMLSNNSTLGPKGDPREGREKAEGRD